MPKKIYEVVEEYIPKKHKIKLSPSQKRCIVLFKKGSRFEPKDIINNNVELLSKQTNKDRHHTASNTVFSTLKIAKHLGIVREVDESPVSFDDFIQQETIQYFADQLRGSKNRNLKENEKLSSTKKDYLYRLYHFNNWLHGREFEFTTFKQVSESQFEKSKQKVVLTGVEHLLELYQRSFNTDSDYVRVIKKYLNDPVHKGSSVGYMKLKHTAILSYFEKNESPLKFRYDPHIKYQDYSEANQDKILSLEDLGKMLTTGRSISLLEKAVVLCKFHRGLDNSTFVDRFNFQAWEQLVKWFGTEIFESWNLDRCPVPIVITRIKTNYTHRGFLERDAIVALQEYLKFRYEKTGRPMKIGEPIFLNTKSQPITRKWIGYLIPKLAKNAGIQNKINNSELVSWKEKTSHELRDLLKSTLIANGCANYVCDLAIGHKVGDSYEKQDKLYPEKSRMEYAKASRQLNILSKISSALNEDYQTLLELQETVKNLKNQNASLEPVPKKVANFLGDEIYKQKEINKSLMDKLNELSKEIKQLKEKD